MFVNQTHKNWDNECLSFAILVSYDEYPENPDLAPSDFHLFPKMKLSLRGSHFDTDNDVTEAIKAFFQDQHQRFYRLGVEQLWRRWGKCVERRGDYVEK